jgi:hypothetical protein
MKKCEACKGKGFTIVYAGLSGEKEPEQCMWCRGK